MVLVISVLNVYILALKVKIYIIVLTIYYMLFQEALIIIFL